jgi:hypothetical protein
MLKTGSNATAPGAVDEEAVADTSRRATLFIPTASEAGRKSQR